MAKKSWRPWMTPQEMNDAFDSGLDAHLHSRARGDRRPGSCSCGERGWLWTPCADVVQTPAGLVVRVELSGTEQEHIHVEVREGLLWVWGERAMAQESDQAAYHSLERAYGPFARSFRLPANADPERITAAYKDGLLTVTVGIRANRPRTIRVD